METLLLPMPIVELFACGLANSHAGVACRVQAWQAQLCQLHSMCLRHEQQVGTHPT